MLPKEILKRTGKRAPFDAQKITTAIRKAFFAVTSDTHDAEAERITGIVLEDIESLLEVRGDDFVPGVEDVQDLVESAIMEEGFFDVAKAYIIYRFEHAEKRESEKEAVKEKIQKSELVVEKRDGQKELFSVAKLRKTLKRASRGYEDVVDFDAILEQVHKEVYDGITTEDIAHALVLVIRSFIERDPAYSQVAARVLLETTVYKDVINYNPQAEESFEKQYQQAFVRAIKQGVDLELIDDRMLQFDLDKLSRHLKPERDDELKYLGAQTLYDRYFIRNKQNDDRHVLLESPQIMWMRVAMGLALLEDRKEEQALKFYEMLSTLRYIPSTPTLFFAGTPYSQLSSCYLGVVDDDLESIFNAYADYAEMAKHAGGIAYSWSKIRATGARVKSTGIESNGVVPFLKILDSTVTAINRSGRRRGACCAYLEMWHLDIEDFVELRKNTGDDRRRTHDTNTATWIPDLFMKRVRDDEEWTLFSPDEVMDLTETYGAEFEKRYRDYEQKAEAGDIRLFKKVRARDLWKRTITQLFETGHPWITWKDPSNIRSPQDHVGVVHNSNLCTEITLNNEPDEEIAVCNLGSINLARHIKDSKLDREMIEETVTTAMRMLDNVIDLNFYPVEENRKANFRHRPVGLGIMGFQDALYKLDINFDSEESVRFADESMELISYYAIYTSSKLARQRGAYQTYKGSKWDRGIFPVDTLNLLEEERGEKVFINRDEALDWEPVRRHVRRYGMRNSNCMAMAPTATISNIAGCFPTIEPIYKNIYVKSNISGSFIITNHYLIEDLKKEGLWNQEMLELIKGQEGDIQSISAIPDWIKEKYREVFIIDPKWLVKAAAHRGKWIDQSQSLNIFYNGSSGAELSDVYLYAWQSGLKTTYYLRTLGASAVEQSTVKLANQQNLEKKKKEAQEAVVKVKEQVHATHAERANSATANDSDAKLCRIDDPECESCQ